MSPRSSRAGNFRRIDVFALLDEIRAIAQNGLAYTEGPFDRERYERLLQLAAREYEERAGLQPELISERFGRLLGYETTKVGVDGAVFDERGRVLLIRRTDDEAWGLVSGFLDPNESPEDALVREFAEELGVPARVERLAAVVARSASAEYGPHSIVSLVYLCSIGHRDFTLQPHEVLDAAWQEIDDVAPWHHNHDALARQAREVWWRWRTGL